PSAAFGRVGLVTKIVAERVDAERGVLNRHDTRDTADQKAAERRNPAAPKIAKCGRQNEGDNRCNQVNVAMLPHDERILFQIRDVVERRRRIELEQKPANMGMEQSVRDAIRIVVVVDILVMAPMFTRPEEHGVLECCRTENQYSESHQPVPLVGPMRKESVITDRN